MRRVSLPVLLSIVWLMLVAAARPARAAPPDPLRVYLACEDAGRTKACPAFLRGFIDESPLLRDAPRATAQVTLYVAQAEIANADRVHLRFVGQVRGAPASIEVDADVDTRADDDTQRAQLRPAFVRGVALYVAALYPDAVEIKLVAPQVATGPVAATSPWGAALGLTGFGSWTGPYQSGNASAQVEVTRTATCSRIDASIGVSGGLSRSPAVEGVSFDRTQWGTRAALAYERHLSPHLAAQVATAAWREDPKGQYRYGSNAQVGIEWDHYPSDDPRGNVLAVAYVLSVRADGYNFPTVDGARAARYLEHAVHATASLRHDKITYRLGFSGQAELIHPARRYTLSVSPGIEIQLGAHIDLSFEGSLTRRQLPAFAIPVDDPEAIGRADYAQPTSMNGFASLRVHWDATNGVRNNRFANL